MLIDVLSKKFNEISSKYSNKKLRKNCDHNTEMSFYSFIRLTLIRRTKSDKERVTHHYEFFLYGLSNHHYI